ncbi:MAG: hypothetical protein AAGI38_11405 [Bacteroidota bacterium]
MNKEEQKRLRNYLASLVKMPKNNSDRKLAKWAGSIDSDSIAEMQHSIDDEFGKVDKNEW